MNLFNPSTIEVVYEAKASKIGLCVGMLVGRWLTGLRRRRAVALGATNTDGNLSLLTALLVTPSAVAIVMAIEIVGLNQERALMQSAADAAALAGARDLMVSGSSQRNAAQFAEKFALTQVGSFANRARVRFTARVVGEGNFTIEGVANRPSFFGNMVPRGGFTIQVRSVAENLVRQPLCILGQNTDPTTNSISGDGTSSVLARGCTVHANGDIVMTTRAKIQAGTVRTSGTVRGGSTDPLANIGALQITDPFQDRSITPTKPCDKVPDGGTDVWRTGTLTLQPGMHRTQFVMRGSSVMKLQPGEHYFCSSSFITEQSRLESSNAVMIFIDGGLTIRDTATVSLKGRQTGPWAGFVIVTGRSNANSISFLSRNADELLGTIYMPNSHLLVDTPGNVGEASQWSVIVANRLITNSAAQLVINSQYQGSPVPVPAGVGNNVGGASDIPLRLRE
jgi:Flp pilus assembly protein TadG